MSPARRLATLTRREREALDAILDGLGTKQIAPRLGISLRTLEKITASLYRKMEVNSPRQLFPLLMERRAFLLEVPSGPVSAPCCFT